MKYPQHRKLPIVLARTLSCQIMYVYTLPSESLGPIWYNLKTHCASLQTDNSDLHPDLWTIL